jgi:hypothetical protein
MRGVARNDCIPLTIPPILSHHTHDIYISSSWLTVNNRMLQKVLDEDVWFLPYACQERGCDRYMFVLIHIRDPVVCLKNATTPSDFFVHFNPLLFTR